MGQESGDRLPEHLRLKDSRKFVVKLSAWAVVLSEGSGEGGPLPAALM